MWLLGLYAAVRIGLYAAVRSVCGLEELVVVYGSRYEVIGSCGGRRASVGLSSLSGGIIDTAQSLSS